MNLKDYLVSFMHENINTYRNPTLTLTLILTLALNLSLTLSLTLTLTSAEWKPRPMLCGKHFCFDPDVYTLCFFFTVECIKAPLP